MITTVTLDCVPGASASNDTLTTLVSTGQYGPSAPASPRCSLYAPLRFMGADLMENRNLSLQVRLDH